MKSMTINRIELYRCEVEVNFNYWFGKREKDTVLLACVQAAEAGGWGEYLNFFGQNSFSQLQEYAAGLLGKDAMRLNAVLPNGPDAPAPIRECLEIAVLDLVGKMSGLPVHTLLGGKKRDCVPGMPVIHLGTPEDMAEKVRKWDYRYFKVKVSCEPDRDVAIMEAIRKANPTCVLYVDFNCGYSDFDQAAKMIREMKKLRVSVIEDPVDMNIGLERYKELREAKTGVKLMIDARARSLESVFEIVKHEAADIINLHTSVQGGLFKALEKVAVARGAGIPCIVGSDGFIGISDAAYQSLAGVILDDGYPCEEVGGRIYHGTCIVEDPYLQKDGMIYLSDKPGLGVTVDSKKMEKIVVEKIVIQ
ncbi:MAG: mandelate racemase/muconate lactonizing enzyme family protein [Phycisphaerae bacterium]